jgi:hypothetical protein
MIPSKVERLLRNGTAHVILTKSVPEGNIKETDGDIVRSFHFAEPLKVDSRLEVVTLEGKSSIDG